ncbi:hypothetical protein AKJ40_02695 [candidate division MSBL1 archaeon SCGC-AAA259M10]|uniref:Uncharacterized protein n=1 Tax=candidate division MSBL1 archaeon SCGC-AAA259M10 TaxID=1698270 RepID=A0A133UZP9_9EURY|nr:hypothetical protein AKJ40_02695 [candidate division MSBL1 archaeon SCGC-AAA259M10]
MKMVFDKLKSIFGGGGEEEEVEEGREREREKLSLEEVRKRIVDRKSHPLQEIEKDYQPILEKVSNIRGKIESLNKDLVGAEPGGEVHPNIYKSAKEGKRLLTDKADRAVEKMKAPQGPTWNGLLDLNESLKGAVNLLRNARAAHGRQVGAVFENEMSRLGRLTDSLQSVSRELDDSLRKGKATVDDLDETMEKIKERKNLLGRKNDLEKKLGEFRGKKEEIEGELDKERESLASLEKSERFEELEEVKDRIEELTRKKEEIRKRIGSKISELARPLRKMSKMIERDKHMVSSTVLEAIDLYQKDPVQTALEEEEGLPKLNAMLQELESVLEGEMKLGEREREKRLEEVQDIIENEKIEKLREDYHRTETKIDKLKKKRKKSPLLEKKEKLEGSIQSKKSEKSEIEERIEKKEEELEEVSEQIDEKSLEIRERVESALNAQVENL